MVAALILLAGLALAAALSWLLAERLRRPLDDTARHAAPGQFAELSQGRTHYRWDGAVRGPVLVCIHGLTSASYVWDALVPRLGMMGFRVLRYDLYGRGLSDRPEGTQDAAFFLRQLEDLLEHQGLSDDLTLLGYSMGGTIATDFAAEEPHRLTRVILLAPAGLGFVPRWLERMAMRVPVVGAWLMRVPGGWLMRRALRRGPQTDITPRQMAETRFAGYLPAVRSSLRHMLSRDLTGAHHQIARNDIPLLAIWGEDDPFIPLRAVGRLAQANRRARQVTLPKAGHMLPVTHPDQIHTAIQGFLRNG
ncbi:alpha/beta fold hydrolase [Actibacterium ureilyticum]|uniref:alpha/beta fold hydrolase n=1 Tax=Actibacterium ureilyticum TaxID=1590614 RepID=UPI000BAB1E9E|nr:alpha/beta hydrolase [Actibacterium ureilyticum]